MSCYLGFDYGRKRVGVAVGQRVTMSASPLLVLRNDQTLLERIAQLLKTWQPSALIVGLPLTEDGAEQAISAHARRFAQALKTRFKLEVELVDERFSSRAADSDFREARASGLARKKHAGELDAHAAVKILEQFLRA